jgi:hypothetical protein
VAGTLEQTGGAPPGPVEAVFSAMKPPYGVAFAVAYQSRPDVFAFATIYNLRRAAILQAR